MPLVHARTIYERARMGGYAVGGFDAEHLDMVKAIIEAADEVKSPVIVFIWEKDIEASGEGYLESMVMQTAQHASVPVAIHLDHGTTLKSCLSAIVHGHTGVMIDCSHFPFEENVQKTKEVVDICHLLDAFVEAELGTVPRTFESDEPEYMEAKEFTDPDQAVEFVNRTGVDALTVSIGEESGVYTSAIQLDIDLLREIKNRLKDTNLIMHGGSGTPPDQMQQIVTNGIVGIRFATELRITYFDVVEKIRKDLGRDFPDTRKISQPAREAVKALVKERMKQMGSWGQACTDGLCPPIYKGVDVSKDSLSRNSSSDVDRIVEIIQRSLTDRDQ